MNEPVVRPTLDVVAVVARSLLIWRRNWQASTTLGLLGVLPFLLLVLFGSGGRLEAMIASAASVPVAAVLAGAVVFLVFEDMQGRRARFEDSLRIGLARLVPVLGVALAVAALVLAGMMLFVVPGLFLACVLWVAVPAAVVERTGIQASLMRSADLTRGARWRVVGIVLVIGVLIGVAGFLLSSLVASVLGGSGRAALGVQILVNGALAGLSAIATVVGYHDLRVGREKADLATMAADLGRPNPPAPA